MPENNTAPLSLGQHSVGFGPQGFGAGGNTRPPVPRPPEQPPARNPVLTRADMVTVIERGGSIAYQGRVIAHADLLPTDEELSAGDVEQTARVAAQHEANIAYSQAMLARMKAKPADAKGDSDAEAKAKAEADAKAKADADAKNKANGGK